jgi:hypothetical protein
MPTPETLTAADFAPHGTVIEKRMAAYPKCQKELREVPKPPVSSQAATTPHGQGVSRLAVMVTGNGIGLA